MGKASRAKWRQKLMDDNGRKLTSGKLKDESKLFDKLLRKAEEHVETFEYELARKCYEDALKENPDHVLALEAYAGVLLELGEIKEAENSLLKATDIAPEEGHSKYFSLAQIYNGLKSIEFYRKGIAMIQNQIQTDNEANDGAAASNPDLSSKRLDMSNAYCAMVEIYMTDCCDSDDAEEKCKEYIQNSIDSCSTNPEAFQCFANYQLITGNFEEAKQSMDKSTSLWLPKYQELRENRDSSDDILECPLSYDSRISTSKMLIELEMYNEASDILEGLLDENDEVVDVWYLLGWLNFLRGEEYYGNAKFYLDKTKEVSKEMGDEDNEQMQHVEDLLVEISHGEYLEEAEEEECNSDEWETEDEMEQ